MNEPTRCAWSEGDPLLRAYHDAEWGVPVRDRRRLWEALMLEGFQAGLAWIIVLRKREAFRSAFRDFEPAAVAAFDEARVEVLLQDASIIRSRAKIEAAIASAKALLAFEAGGGDFVELCWSFTDGQVRAGGGGPLQPSTALSEGASRTFKALGFRFVGPTTVHAWMQAVGIVNDHEDACFRREQLGGGR